MATRATARRPSSTRTSRPRPKPKTRSSAGKAKTSTASKPKSASAASRTAKAGATAGAAAATAGSGARAAAAARPAGDSVAMSSDARSQLAGSQPNGNSSPLVRGIQDAYSPTAGGSKQPGAAENAKQPGAAEGTKQNSDGQSQAKDGGRQETIEQHEQRIQSLYEKMQKGEIGQEEFNKELKDFYNHAQQDHQQKLQQQRQDFEKDWDKRQDAYGDRKQEIDGIVNTKNDDLRNLKITQEYSKLSKETRDVIGADGGANWSTWATWASKQAGQTIRQEDLGGAGKFGKGAVDALPDAARYLPGLGEAKRGADMYDATSKKIAEGNRKVFKEIAPHFARFNETFKGDTAPNAEKLARFQEGFKPGSVQQGGQDLLKDAFTNYYNAKFETDPDRKKELMFLGNGQIGLHEQNRLQPEIQGSLPYGTRGLATDHMMSLGLPNSRGQIEALPLGQDVPKFNGRNSPLELQSLENRDANSMVRKYDKSPYNLEGSGAKDWTKLPDRMNYILDLFRSRHDDGNLFRSPFSASQTRSIEAGVVPGGPL